MDALPVAAIAGAACALVAAGVLARRKRTEPDAPGPAVPARGQSLPPRPSLRPSRPPPSLRESLRNVFLDSALGTNGVGFGKSCEWVVARTTPEVLAAAVGASANNSTWKAALALAISGKGIAILGPVDGFCFAVSEPATFRIGTSHLLDDPRLFARIADAVGSEVMFFQSDSRAEGFAWLRARPGLVERAFSVIDTHTLADDGPQDEIEEQVRAQRPVPDGEEWWPGEEDVFEMAAGWCIDPWSLDDRDLEMTPALFAPRV